MPATSRPWVPAGLRWRLTVWVAGVMVLAAAVVFVVVYINAGAQLESQIDRDVSSDNTQLAQVVRSLAGKTPQQIAGAAARYLGAQPFRATSTLMFVLVPGEQPVSNHPEVFGTRGPEPGEATAEQARENRGAAALLQPHAGYSVRQIADVGRVRILEQTVNVGGLRVTIGAGEPLASVERAQHGVAKAFVLAGSITLVLALIASYLAGARVTAPLRRMAGVAARVDAGDLEPRMAPAAGSGEEVRVLAETFNHMLDRLSEAFAAQREFVADASHELRTPLTVIRGQLEVLAAQESPPAEEVRRVERLVQAEITRISRLVDDLLTLAKAEQTDFLRPEPINLRSFVAELWDGLSLTAKRRFELGPVPEGTLKADPDRLAQALRNLAGNAIEHTTEPDGLVRLEVAPTSGGAVRFTVLDDGPGIPASERERVFTRFHRTDPARSRAAGGAGLGLAIVRAIAEAHRGSVRARDPYGANGDGGWRPGDGGRWGPGETGGPSAGDGTSGGARIELTLPGFQPR